MTEPTSACRRLAGAITAAACLALASPPPVAASPRDTRDGCATLAALLQAGQVAGADLLAQAPPGPPADSRTQRARADDLRCLAQVRRDERRDDEAVRALVEARTVYLTLEAHSEVGVVSRELGGLHWRNGRGAETTAAYRAAAAAFRRAGQIHDEADALRSSTFGTGYPTAEERYRVRLEALALIVDTPDRSPAHRLVRGTLLHDFGDRRFGEGRYADAHALYEAAARLLSADADNRRALSLLLTSRGRLARAEGDALGAVDQYTRAAALQRQAGDDVGRGQTLNALAIALSHLGRHTEAITALHEALDVVRRAGPPWRAAVGRLNLAMAYLDAGNVAAALSEFEQYRSDDGRSALGPGYRLAEIALSLEAGRPQEALETATLVIEATAAGGHLEEVRARALVARARVYLHLRQRDAALADLAVARDVWESLRASLTPADVVRRGFADATVAGFYALYVTALADAGAAASALEATELARARALVDLLARRRDLGPGPTSTVHRTDVTPRPLELTRLQHTLLADTPPAPGDTHDVALERARHAGPLRADDIQGLADQQQTVIAAYWVGRARSYVWVSRPRAPMTQHVVEAGSDELARLVVAASGVNGTAALRRLYELLIAPLEDVLPFDGRLLVVPHGVLNRLSFATLLDARQRYLVERVSVRYVPSLTSLAQLRWMPPGGHQGRGVARALVVGAPALPRATERRFPPLPGARREAAAVSAVLRAAGTSTDVLTGGQASVDAVRGALADARPHVVHIAAHGVAFDHDPLLSYIALTPTGEGVVDEARLTAADVHALDLDADLVVLSSCRTADGPVSGDGITGMARAFLAAGSRAVVASLWDVPDQTAGQLVPHFYEAWQQGVDKAAALRLAQRRLIEQLRSGAVTVPTRAGPLVLAEHPSLWGGLVLIGDQ